MLGNYTIIHMTSESTSRKGTRKLTVALVAVVLIAVVAAVSLLVLST